MKPWDYCQRLKIFSVSGQVHILLKTIIHPNKVIPSITPMWQVLYDLFLNLFFIYLFLAVLGLRFCERAFSSCGKRGPLFIAVRGPLTVAASLIVEHRLQTRRLSSCGSWAQLPRGMWDLPRPGLEPVSPALADRFSTTAPPGKPYMIIFDTLATVIVNSQYRSFTATFSLGGISISRILVLCVK